MTITQTTNYKIIHIGAIRNNKDLLNESYNVDIKITRKRFGEYQEVEITGLNSQIKKVLKELNIIVEQSQQDYIEYQQRKSMRRKTYSQHTKKSVGASSASVRPKKKHISKKTNLFAALQVDEDDGIQEKLNEMATETEESDDDDTEFNINKISWADL